MNFSLCRLSRKRSGSISGGWRYDKPDKAYEGFDYRLPDRTDPEVNVFQIMQKTK